MENWKRALLAGSSVASVILLLRGKRAPGILFGGISLATLASEYPDQFAEFRENLPDYVERGTRFLDVVTRAGERKLLRAAVQPGMKRCYGDDLGTDTVKLSLTRSPTAGVRLRLAVPASTAESTQYLHWQYVPRATALRVP